MSATWHDTFLRPGPEWRGKPFWSWNGDLDRDELLRQIRVMQAMGLGGFFMHSRTGLVTEYLGDDWFELTNACADEAAARGMEAWLYDEDRWPSGTAGGLVTEDPRHRLRFVSLRRDPGTVFEWHDDLLAAFALDLDGLRYTNLQRLGPDTPPEDYRERTVITFTVEEAEPSSFYNGYTYVDTLSAEATQRYLELTHEQYAQRCGDRLGSSIRGIFTDEPHRGALMSGFGISNHNGRAMAPWTALLPAEFEQRFGYDLVDRLPELFLQPEGCPTTGGAAVSPVKWHYCELLQSLFLANFAKPLYDWCEQHGLRLTGHVLHEDSLTCQTAMQGSLMRFYQFMHDPGVDVLTEGNRAWWIVKQLSSAARQLGQEWLLSELYGCTGWQMSFESHKAVGAWQALFGINLRCHHLSWVTMAGEAKRDYPASILHQSAWWRDYDYVESWFARLGVVLSAGHPVCDTLVLNPVESVWCQIHVGWADSLSPTGPTVQHLEQGHAELFGMIAGAQIDFDYGDEAMLAELGSVECIDGPPVLRLGQAAYRQVVVPRVVTLRGSTMALLESFRAAGGTVIFVGEPPTFVDAVPSVRARLLANRAITVPWSADALRGALRPALAVPVEIVADDQPCEQVFAQVRRDGEQIILVAINVDREQAVTATVRLRADGAVTELDCTDGAAYAQPARREGEWLCWEADFAASGERVYVVGPPALAAPRPSVSSAPATSLAGPFAYRLDEPNVLVLDRPRWRLDGGAWQQADEVLRVDTAVRAAFDLPARGGEMVQPWYRARFGEPARPLGRVELAYTIEVEALPDGEVHLAIERPDLFEATLNGMRLAAVPAVPSVDGIELPAHHWVDTAFHRLIVPLGALSLGTNELVLGVTFDDTVNLEAAYLLGGFGVQVDGQRAVVTRLPAALSVGDLTSQGLPFYGGTVTYRLGDLGTDALTVAAPAFEAAVLRVRRAGETRLIAWQPYLATLPAGAGEAELDVVLTRRNTFGPLHLVPMRQGAYGPGHWTTGGAAWSDDYQLWPAGLLAPVDVSPA
ncbi:MAG: hypothetical protein HZB16_04840 [Armatimonadetes bacterium]|nr:hypothetical protein [Armatimonadota bacterium]